MASLWKSHANEASQAPQPRTLPPLRKTTDNTGPSTGRTQMNTQGNTQRPAQGNTAPATVSSHQQQQSSVVATHTYPQQAARVIPATATALNFDDTADLFKQLDEADKEQARKKRRGWRMTARDVEMLRFLYTVGMATLAHFAVWTHTTPNNIRQRVKLLHEAGYVRTWDDFGNHTIYTITRDGMTVIGESGQPKSKPALSTIRHNLKTNTLYALASLSTDEAHELSERFLSDDLTVWSKEERRREAYFQRKAREVESWRHRDWNSLTAGEKRSAKFVRDGFLHLPQPEALVMDTHGFKYQPILIHENLIKSDEGVRGNTLAQEAFYQENADNPQHHLSEVRKWYQKDAQARQEWMDSDHLSILYKGFGGSVPGLGTKTTHRPDAVVLGCPGTRQDGTLAPNALWIEVEEHVKPDVQDTVRTIVQALAHPFVRGVWFYTDSADVKSHIHRAMNFIVKRIMSSPGGAYGLPQMSQQNITELLRSSVRILPSVVLNKTSGRAIAGLFG